MLDRSAPTFELCCFGMMSPSAIKTIASSTLSSKIAEVEFLEPSTTFFGLKVDITHLLNILDITTQVPEKINVPISNNEEKQKLYKIVINLSCIQLPRKLIARFFGITLSKVHLILRQCEKLG